MLAIIVEYLWQIVVALGGSLVSIGIALVKWHRGEEVDEDVFWPTVGAVIVALIGIALQERAGRLGAENALETHVASTVPKLKPTIENTVFKRTKNGTDMYVQMRIVGDGPDSIADGYHLKIHTARGGFAKIPARPIPQATSAVDVKLGIEPSNALHEKTPTTPIKRGAAVRGWLRFPIGNEIPESISGKGGRLAVVVSDYLGRRYRSKATFTGQRVMLDDTQDLEFFCPGLSAKP